MIAVQVQLLGPPRALLEGEVVAFKADKRYQCLGYLAFKRDWVSRDELAYLFWPDIGTSNARHSLRQLVRRVRALPWLPTLDTERERIRWSMQTDIEALKRALEEKAYPRLLTAYTGDLFEGLDGLESNEFTTWLEHEREHLRAAWRRALLQHARELEGERQIDHAVSVMEVLLARDPLDEEAVRALLRLGLRANERRRVLEAYQGFCRQLERELELTPTTETQQLAAALQGAAREATPTAVTAVTTKPEAPALPRLATSFIGRDLELADIAHLLAQPDCRLLTLTGFGGVGKTRLALQAAEELGPRYRDGAAFVALDALENPEALPTAIASGLELTLGGKAEALEQLIQQLKAKHLLLVLDTFEHLIGAAPLVAQLLDACPELDLLVTSRERLGLEAEWLLPIGGLSFPHDGNASLQDALSYDALRLFVARAERVRPIYALSESDLPHALTLCQLVDGSPLGLELAAVWLRAVPLKEIVLEINENMDFLEAAEKPDRQRSLRAVFEHSWRLLTSHEQQVLSQLSVFKGGFRREAAAVVVGAPIAVLAALVDKSLLRVSPEGRYDRHPLVYQYAREKLAEHADERVRSENRHAEYYARLLQQLNQDVKSEARGIVLRSFEAELENIRVAWHNLTSRARHTELLRLAGVLRVFLNNTCRYREGIELFQQNLNRLGANEVHVRLMGVLLSNQAWLYYRIGRFEEATQLAEQGLARLSSRQDHREKRTGLNVLGAIAWARGEYVASKAHWSKALSVCEGSPEASAAFLNNVAIAEMGLGNYQKARQHLETALALNRQLGDETRITNNLNNLGDLYLDLGDPQSALETFREALQGAEVFGYRQVTPHLLHGLAKAHGLLGHPREAYRYSDHATVLFRHSGQRSPLGLALSERGCAAISLGNLPEAKVSIAESLKLAVANENAQGILSAITALAELHQAQARPHEAASLFAVVAAHPNAQHQDRARAKRQLAKLKATGQAASDVTQAQDLNRLAQGLLQQLATRS